MSGPALLDIDGLSVAYRPGGREVPVLRDVSFHIDAGETYGLVGESGCGKSTLAMAVMRYLGSTGQVTAGAIRVDGDDVLGLDRKALQSFRGARAAAVYQEPGRALNPTMRVGDQIAEVLRYHRGTRRGDTDTTTRELLAQVAFRDPDLIAGRWPHELSGGQQQRIVLAMAIAGRPRLLILDEPTTGLDVTVEAEVLSVVRDLRDELAGAVLFISHNLALIGESCDRVGVLYAGRLVEEGAVADVLARPQHPYTAALLGCVPQLGSTKHDGRLHPIPGSLPSPGDEGPGCPFASRCPLVGPDCIAAAPPLAPIGPGRLVACWRAGDAAVPVSIVTSPVAAPSPAGPAPTQEPDELASLRDVTVTYHRTVAAAGVDLTIGRGEAVGLVGESGSGKTTLGRVLLGLVPPSQGAVWLDEHELPASLGRRDDATLRRLQMVFQSPDSTLNPRLTVRTTLERAVKRLGGRRDVEELAASVQLTATHLDQHPGALSGGLKQRAAIARAFAGTPDLVVCDEPVSALDVSVQAGILELLARLQREQGVAYLFISHDLAVTRYLADRIAVMYRGQLVEIGPAASVFARPHHPYTEVLLAAVPTLGAHNERRRVLAADRRAQDRSAHASPEASTITPACPFVDRCPLAVPGLCSDEAPPWQELSAGHKVRCHFGADVLTERQQTVITQLTT
jgi:peptide/nickel transport system ATP-binding protein